MRAISLRLLLTSRALPRQCLGAGLKRSGPVAASSLAISSSSFWSRLETFVPAEAPFAAVDDAYPLAATAAERPVLDEPKAIGPASACRAAEIAHDPPCLNLVCASAMSFDLSPNGITAETASSCATPVARSRGIFTHVNSSKKRR
jgi:hypothetical protein